MRKILISAVMAFLSIASYSQRTDYVEQINKIITPDVALAPLEYLASDDLRGRSPKTEEINIAAKYIADHFKTLE